MGTLSFVLAPLILGGVLLWRFPGYRTIRPAAVIGYLTVTGLLVMLGLYFVAWVSGARVLFREAPVVLCFVVTWQLAFWLWMDTVGRLGQRFVRWARLRRRRRLPVPWRVRVIAPARHALTALVLLPVFATMVVTHKAKWGDGRDPMTALGLPFEAARIPTRDGLMLDGWFIPQPGANRTLLICHGAGANKGNFVWFLGPLAHHGYNLAMFDFRAHGASDGHVTSWGVRERLDVLAAVDWLVAKHAMQARTIVGLGSSQGALALALAGKAEPRVEAFILDSPFISASRLAHDYTRSLPLAGPALANYLLGLLSLWSGVDLFAESAKLEVAALGARPVLIIQGKSDALVPAAHAREIFQAARGPRGLWYGSGGHSNVVTTDPSGYAAHVFEFLDRTLGPATGKRMDLAVPASAATTLCRPSVLQTAK